MMTTKTIHSKSEIVDELQASFAEVAQFIQSVPAELFHQRQNDKWSIAEHLQHLILSNVPLAAGLKKNKLFFLAFGIFMRDSADYETLKANYFLRLKQGVVAPSKYVPSDLENETQETLLVNWKTVGGKYAPRLEKWTEKDLDKYGVPHPALGKITLREMLFSTIFHNEHHMRSMQRIVDAQA